jgi:hypothetical protein
MSIKRSNILPVSFIFIALTISSCGGATEEIEPTATSISTLAEDGSDSADPASDEAAADIVMVTGECANPYFPVVLNANWAYAASGSEFGPYTFTSTVSEVFPDRFTLTHEFDDLTLTQQWECKPEGLVSLELGGGTAASIVTGDVDVNLETSNISGVTFPGSISVGDEWTHSMDVSGEVKLGTGVSGTAEGRATTKFQAVGIENVEVPAGTFEAIQVDTEFTLDMTVTTEGVSIPVLFTTTGSSWHVPNIGWVRGASTSTMFEIPITETIELKAYSIP